MAIVHIKDNIPGAIRIDRQTKWGNPFVIDGDRLEVINMYRRWLWDSIKNRTISTEELAELHDRDLACWCAPQPCHGDVLARATKWSLEQLKENK